jgi:hypothetical protein
MTYYALYCRQTGCYMSSGLNSTTLDNLFGEIASYFSIDDEETAAFLISPSNPPNQKLNLLNERDLFLDENTIPFVEPD